PLIASVMVIDDQLTSRIILESILKTIGNNITVRTFDNATSALRVAEEDPPDLILVDYKMPELNGVEFTRRLRAIPSCSDIPVIVITIIDDKSVLYEALEAGATDFLNKPIDHYECKVRCRNLLTLRRQQLIIRNRASSVENQINEAIHKVQRREKEALEILARIGLYRENHEALHTRRIGKISALIAGSMGLDAEFCNTIELAAPLSDIGKIGIPDHILLKEGGLEPEEIEVMQSHSTLGYELLKDCDSPILQMAATIALYHHEMFNGEGHPHGLSGEDIPLPARITAVADILDALFRRRSYSQAWRIQDALDEIQALKGTKLDPKCVDALFAQIEGIMIYFKDQPGSQVKGF
ncbi:MAG: response regulator, partial [Gammaproteobacteria bacterium]